jgi:hypothetical protein
MQHRQTDQPGGDGDEKRDERMRAGRVRDQQPDHDDAELHGPGEAHRAEEDRRQVLGR